MTSGWLLYSMLSDTDVHIESFVLMFVVLYVTSLNYVPRPLSSIALDN